jgi:hypothetical protein
LWAASEPERLSDRAIAYLEDADHELLL